MGEQLTYVMIPPYSIIKSRTGGILGRLLASDNVSLAGARMFIFSNEFVAEYIETFASSPEPWRALWKTYIREHLGHPNVLGLSGRCMVLLFRGENARAHIKDDVIGSITDKWPRGDTIRGTYGDYIVDRSGEVRYFEPAVITGRNDETLAAQLRLLAKYARPDGGILEQKVAFPGATNVQTTLVILKPDNFYRPSRRPGNIVDVFSKTGLNIVAASLFSFTAKMGEEFYGQLRPIFVEKLRGGVADALKEHLKGAFGFAITDETYDQMAGLLAADNAETEFNRIVEYMSGIQGGTHCPPAQRDRPGPNKCLALLYRGQDAIEAIRKWLGSTNPDQADAGTVRSDFGRDLMRNAAHASDSAENAERERRIIGLWTENPDEPSAFERTIHEYLDG